MKNEKPILWMLHEFNLEAFIRGKNSSKNSKNPFIKNTNSWYSWNRGKNEKID